MASKTVAPFVRLNNPIAQDISRDCLKVVQFEQLVNFKITSNFTIAPNDSLSYKDDLAFIVRTPGRGFALVFEHESNYPGNIKLAIFIVDDEHPKSCILLPSEFLGKELTLEASYTEDTNIISVSVTDGSQTYAVSIKFDLRQIITGVVEVGFMATPIQVSVWYYDFTFTGRVTYGGLQ